MIRYTKGNLLDANTEALINTVNTVGVMGKGIALQFKEAYPKNYKVYRDACKAGTFQTGQVLAVHDGDLLNQKWIINFPTKAHWKGKSQYSYIEEGLKALKQKLIELEIKSVAMPPLGCGNGGLDWEKVKTLIESELANLDIDILVFEPNDAIRSVLQKQETGKEVKLTPARAMLLYTLFAYESMGEQSSLFVANKLAYFLQRSGENLKLKFEAHHYGPFSVQLNHVLYHLNGVYLNGLEQNQSKPFEPLQLNYQRWEEVNSYVQKELKPEQLTRLHDILNLISGFESTFSLELLATVAFLLAENPDISRDEILREIESWSARKIKMFRKEYVDIAHQHLTTYAQGGLKQIS